MAISKRVNSHVYISMQGPFIGRSFPNSSMIGTGLTPEGIFQNEAIYEFMNENAYVKESRNLTEWFVLFY